MEKEISFKDSEHLAGFHTTYQEKCYECAKEKNLIWAFKTVNDKWGELYPDGRNTNALTRSDNYTNPNPLE